MKRKQKGAGFFRRTLNYFQYLLDTEYDSFLKRLLLRIANGVGLSYRQCRKENDAYENKRPSTVKESEDRPVVTGNGNRTRRNLGMSIRCGERG